VIPQLQPKYPGKSRAAKLREARKRTSRPPRLRSSSDPLAPALARNEAARCAVKGCRDHRRGLARYCLHHETNRRNTGHPVGRDIRRSEWRPYVLQAEAFVREQLRAGHPTIMAAIAWVARELRQAERPTSYSTAHHIRYCEALLRAHRNGVDATAFVARAIVGELADDRFTGEPGPRFLDDTHSAHQKTKLFLQPMPYGAERSSWARRKRLPQITRHRAPLRFGTRAYAHARINKALGVLALKAAAEIKRREAEQSEISTQASAPDPSSTQRESTPSS
jgi:hypothetical protein